MSDPAVDKVDPATLELRAAPRRVVRFKRNILIGAAVIGCLAILIVAYLALKGPGLHALKTDSDVTAGHRPTPDSLAGLPATYGDAAKPKVALGPPLPGDLGPPILEREKQLGTTSANAGDEAARAEEERLAQAAQQIQSAGVFFQIGQHAGGAGSVTGAAATATSTSPADGTAVATATAAPHVALDPEKDQNDQQHKLDFLGQTARDTVNAHTLQAPGSPYTVMAGSVIAASLLTGLNSDLPGMVTAQVTEPVYDSATGRALLIPQGSRLIGAYDSVVAFGQSRALLAWQRIVMPDGSSIQIDNLPATDAAGYAGLKDKVDFHTWTLLKGIAMSTLIGVGGQVAFGNSSSNLVEAIRESTQESTNQAGQRIVEKDLNIQPTLTVRPGWPLRVIVHKDLVLKPYKN